MSVINFPGRLQTRHDREIHRWQAVAMTAIIIARDRERKNTARVLRYLQNEFFQDVPDDQPEDLNDTQTLAAVAVKMLLEMLTEDDPDKRRNSYLAALKGEQLILDLK